MYLQKWPHTETWTIFQIYPGNQLRPLYYLVIHNNLYVLHNVGNSIIIVAGCVCQQFYNHVPPEGPKFGVAYIQRSIVPKWYSISICMQFQLVSWQPADKPMNSFPQPQIIRHSVLKQFTNGKDGRK